MINENEIQISNKSYINKDFASIYPELLDLAKKMSRRWDPETSNESDPGIVLLKLLGFIGDKLNYNIDKNVLECFMPSCTQESSMRKLCDMLGYEMGYYIAPEVAVSFSYVGDEELPDGVTFPALSTSVTNDDESVFYTLTENLTLSASGDGEPKSAPAIQGTVNTLTIGDSELVGLENLDDNNRIYFPVSGVAQNGVFIVNATSEGKPSSSGFWRRSANLNVESVGEQVYKFGYDSSEGLPYVEFPSDIVSLIGNGLIIRYVVTDGVSGAVSAGMLTRLSSPTSIEVGGEAYSFVTDPDEATDSSPVNLVINNQSASTAGADPETIDEAYNSFKRRIGTFDTLVTCRDYANAIYNMELNGSPVVSNVQVADRRDDINRSWRVLTLTENGQATVNANIENPAFGDDSLDANTLCLYLFNPYASNTESGYSASFRSQGITPRREVVEELESSATASHDYAGYGTVPMTRAGDIAAIKNYLTLNARLTTTYKVNDAEKLDIETNVKRALVGDYNMREVDWGYEIPFESLLSTIQGADKRISSVSLAEPVLTTKVAFVDPSNEEVPFVSVPADGDDSNPYSNIMSKNVLAGKLPLFDYDDSFEFDFGQKSENGVTEKARKAATAFVKSGKYDASANPNGWKSGEEYALRSNEVIQFLRPSLADVVIYSAYTNYAFITSSGKAIGKNSDYQLLSGEKLILTYTDSNDEEIRVEYAEGDIISPNFDLAPAEASSGDSGYIKIKDGGVEYVARQTEGSQQITYKTLNSVTLSGTPYYAYWLMDNSDNQLFTEADGFKFNDSEGVEHIGYRKVLGDNEYFFYTDASFRSMATLGSGTTIEFYLTQGDDPTWDSGSAGHWRAPSMDLSEALSGGLLAMRDKWVYFNFRSGLPSYAKIMAIENEVLTLTAGDAVTVTAKAEGEDLSGFAINANEFATLSGLGSDYIISYRMAGSEGSAELANISIAGSDSDCGWQARTRLDLDLGPSSPQELLSGHYVCVYPMDGNLPGAEAVVYSNDGVAVVADSGIGKEFLDNDDVAATDSVLGKAADKLMCNYVLQASGSWNIDLKSAIPSMSDVPDADSEGDTARYWLKFEYPVGFYGYSLEDYIVSSISRDDNGFGTLEFKSDSLEFGYDYPKTGKDSIVALYWMPSAGSGANLKMSASSTKPGVSPTLSFYNDDAQRGKPEDGLRFGLNNISIPKDAERIQFECVVDGKGDSEAEGDGVSYGVLIVARPRFYSGFNPALGIGNFDSNGWEKAKGLLLNELKKVSEYDDSEGNHRSMFMYSADIANSDLLDVADATSPYAFYEYNNVANKFTISEIDFEESDISVVRSSLI